MIMLYVRVAHAGQFISRFFSMPGVTLATRQPDWMHVSCTGLLECTQADVRWELLRHREGGGGTMAKPAEACCAILEMMWRDANTLNACGAHQSCDGPHDKGKSKLPHGPSSR